MAQVKIVADSTCDLPIELVQKNNIGIIPANVIFDKEIYSHFQITNEVFYQRLIDGDSPSTGVPAPRVFKEVFENALEESNEVIVFTLTKKLSGMFSAANLVRDQFFDEKITIIDTQTVTLEMGLIVYLASKLAQEGKSKEEILRIVEGIYIPDSHLFAVVDSLKYLKRGGRISSITWLLGSLLSVKPIIQIEDGLIVSPGKVRGTEHAMELIKKVGEQVIRNNSIETLFCGYSFDKERGKELLDYFSDLANAPEELILAEVGPIVGSHVGPGAIGLSWIGDFKKEWM